MDMESIRAAAIEYETGLAMKKAREEYYEELRVKQEEEENKPLLEKIGDTVNGWTGGKFGENVRSAMGETYGPGSEDMNPTTYRPLGKIEDIISEIPGDFVNAATEVGKTRQNFWHNVSNMQQAYLDAQETGDFSGFNKAVDDTRNAGREASVALANVMASPVRSAARNFIKLNADNPASPYQSLAQSLQMTDVGIEYFTTDEEHLQKSREIEEALGLPPESTLADNAAFKEALEMYYFKQKYDNIEYVWEEYPELKNIASMDKEAAAIALHNIHTVKESHSTIDTFMTFLGKGNRELELHNIQFKIAEGKATDEEIKRAEELKKEIAQDKTKAPGFFQDPLGAMAAGVAESLPEMGQSVAGGVAGGGAAATAITLAAVAATVLTGGTDLLLAGGIAGARAMIMRALASQGGKYMLKTWATTGAVAGMYAPEEGQRYGEYKEMKKKDGTPLYTDEQARYYASAGALANSVLEIAPTFAVAGKALPVATRVFQQSAESIVRQSLGRETLKDIGVAAAGNWLKITATESGEEALQSVADDVIRNIALESKGKDADHYQQYSAGDILTRAGAAFVESLPASMAFGFAGVGGSAVVGAGRAARSRKRAAEMENLYGKQQAQTMMGAMMVEQLQKNVQDGKLNKVAPDVQRQVIREQLKGTGFENAWIDIEMAMQKETGREDLKKIAEAQGMSADELEAAITSNGYMSVPTETLSQLATSPDILDSVSFTPEADSMARMRVNGKKIVEEYEKNMQKAVERQLKLADTIIDNYIPAESDEQRKKQREVLKAVMLQNLQNPAQGWNELYKIYNDELQEKIGSALEALKKGMGNAGLLEVQDEQGNTKTQRYTENDEWYRNFYKIHKRKPTQAELQDMAIAMTIGDPNAPKVAGWVPDSAETQATMEQERPVIETLKQNIDLLNSVKAEAKKMTGVEMELTEGFSPEAFKVYRAISSWTEKAGGKIARAGRMTALLWARHADIVADIITKKTGQKYTAEDYLRKHLLLELVKDGQFGEGLNQTQGELAEEKLKRDMETWKKDLKEAWKRSSDNQQMVQVMETPLVLQMVGARHLPMRIKRSKIETIKKEHPEMKKEVLNKLPEHMADPMAIFKSTTVPGRLVVCLELKGTNKVNVVVPVELDYKENVTEINLLASAYSRKNKQGEIQQEWFDDNFFKNNTVLYMNKEKVVNFYASARLQLPLDRRNFDDSFLKIINFYRTADEKPLMSEEEFSNLMESIKDETDLVKMKNENPGLYQLAGVRATNAPLEALERAKEMESAAAYADDIFKETGWVKGQDGKWRFEIPDNLDAVNWDVFKKGNTDNKNRLLKSVYKNPKLYEAYPWLANIVVEVRPMEGNTYGGVAKNGHGEYIVIKEDIGDEQKSGTLIHEIQHLIQDKEGFAVGGTEETAYEQIMDRIKELNKKIQSYNYGTEYADAVMDQQEMLLTGIENPEAEEILKAEIDELEKKISAKEREEIWQLASDRQYLREALNENMGDENSLYRNLAGEQEARHATDRAIIHTNVERAEKTLAEMKAKYEAEKAKQSPEMKKMLDKLEALREKDEKTDAEFERIDEIQAAMDDKLMQAETFYSWAKDTLDMRKQEAAEKPQPHGINGSAIIVFNGEEFAAKASDINAIKALPLEQLFQRAWHGSPYDFEKFDLGAIGTGEGAQVHGWGLYFAENREVSQRYKEVLSAGKSDIKIMFGDRRLPAFGFVDGLTEAETKAYKAIQSVNYDKDKAIALLRDMGEKESADIVEKAEVDYKENKGKLFEVEIPDNDVLLDEQKTLGEQPNINRLLEEYAEKTQDWSFTAGEINDEETTGKELYDWMVTILGSPKAASEELNKMGIKGITYDGARDGRCFVIFDDKAIDVIEKYNQRAWHGTAFNFKQFDLGAVGTGEGAQAHGYGLCSAAERAVAERYQKVLSEKTKGSFAKFVRRLTGIDIGQKGSLYEVEVPDNNVLLDEEKTFNDQHKNVKAILGKALNEISLADLPDNAKKSLAKGKKAAKDRKVKDLYNDITVYTNRINQVEENLEGEEAEKNIKELEKKIEEAEKQIANIEQENKEQENEEWYQDLTGKEIYKILSNIEGGDKQASQFLNAIGIKGITYNGFEDGRCFVVFDDKAMEIINRYNQQVNGQQRRTLGNIDIKPNKDGQRTIHILETANESTFMHEMAHMFLFDLEELAQIDENSAKQLEIVNKWATWEKGAAQEYKGTDWYKDFADLEQAIIDAEEHGDYETAEKRKAEWRQERFARGFELYLKEGNAPAKGLQAVFRMFKQFLRAIYKRFISDGGKPTEAVKRVMDRMIASEEEIEAAALEDRYRDTLKAGGEKLFNEKEEETMKRWLSEEKEVAKEKVLKVIMKDLEKEKQAEFRAKMDAERERYEKELSQENIFLARKAVDYTKSKDIVTRWFGSVEEFEALDAAVPSMESLVEAHMKEFGDKLDQELIESHLSKEAVDAAMQSGKYRAKMESYILKGMERKKALINKINAKARAAMDSIEDKLNALPEDIDFKLEATNPAIKGIMQEITRLRFAGKWNTADINHIEAMMRASTQQEVRKALKEFKAKQAEAKQDLRDIEEATKGLENFYRDLVKKTTEEKPMTETCNVKYYLDKERNAERRVKAMAKIKNWDMAIQQQQQKVFYSMMVKQARKNKEERDKMVKALEKKLNAKTVRLPKDERYWFHQLLYLIRINKNKPKVPEGGAARLEDLFKEQQETLDLLLLPEELINIRDNGENYGDYNQMSLAKFRQAYDDLIRLYTIGRDKFNFKSIGGKSIEEAAWEIQNDTTRNDGILTLTRKIGPDQGGLSYLDAVGNLGEAGHEVAKGLQRYHTSILKPENILKQLGEKAYKYTYGLLEKAAEHEAKLLEKNLRTIQEINSMFTREERAARTDRLYDFPGTKGWKISKENILMMAINWGTEQNRQRLIGGLIEDGRMKSDKSAQEVQQNIEKLFVETMTEKDWQFIQKLWDYIGSYWHDTAAVEEKLNGVAMGRVENKPFTITTADGKEATLKGGYMHLRYDPDKSSRAEEQEINDAVLSMTAGARSLDMGRGMTKARTKQNIYRELDLHFSVIEQHLYDVIHNIAYRTVLRDVYRLLHYKNYKTGVNLEEYFRRTLGVEAYRVVDTWALDAWRQVNDTRNSADGALNRFFRWVRSNSTMCVMGMRLKPVLDNIGNIPIAMGRIGSFKMLAGMFDFYSNRADNMEEVKQLSAFMRTRAENLDRDLRSQPGTFRAGNRVLEFAREHAYDALVMTDLAVSAPLWKRAYKDCYESKIEEVKKENEENIAKRLELAAKVDQLKAEIAEHFAAAKDIDQYLQARRFGRTNGIAPAQETVGGNPYAGLSDEVLRAESGNHKQQRQELGKELYKAEQQLEQAQQLPVYDDAEILDEASQRAVFEADSVVRETFGSGRVIDQPAVMRSTNEFVRLFTAFYSFFNAQYNMIYMSYMKSKYPPAGTGGIERWAPLARTVIYNVIFSALLTSAVAYAFGLKGDDKDDKEKTVMGPDGKKEKVEIPGTQRFLKLWAQESLSIGTGGLYGIRDFVQLLSDYAFDGKNYGYKMGSIATRGFTELGKAFTQLMQKGEKDAEIAAKEEKRQRDHEEKLQKLKGKKRQEYLQKLEEEQKYKKPPKRITYSEILGHTAKGVASFTAARTGITGTMTNAVTGTMQYMFDTDMRYDPTWKNIIWSALFDKKPVEREIPKKPPAEPKTKKGKKGKQSGR